MNKELYVIFWLMIAFQLKHFYADYPFQNKYMLGKFKTFPEYIDPLSAHCAVHALFTVAILAGCFVLIQLWWIIILDFVTHFIIDRIKASPRLLGRFKPDDNRFWIALGLDQMAHHIINCIFIILIVKELSK